MKCPFCSHTDSKVVDSRETKEGDAIRRRRECERCGRRFTSYERIDPIQYMVVKKDGRREPFDRGRVIAGMLKACQKRPVSGRQLEEVADAKPFNHGRIPDGSGLPQPIRDVTSAVQDTPDVDLAATGHVEDKAGEALERP